MNESLVNGDSFEPFHRLLPNRTHQKVFHETYHYWQTLRLPFMDRYAVLSLRTVLQAFEALAVNDPAHSHWSAKIPALGRLSWATTLLADTNGDLMILESRGPTVQSNPEALVVTPILLLETAASLAEFQISVPTDDFSDDEAFSLWCKRNPAYLSVIRWVSTFLSSENTARRCLIPMVNAAFSTSIPERAFAYLLHRVRRIVVEQDEVAQQFLSQPEPCRWGEVLSGILKELELPSEPEEVSIDSEDLFILSRASLLDGNYGSPDLVHPFLHGPAKRWNEQQRSRAGLGAIMNYPAFVSKADFGVCMTEFMPPLSVYRFHLSGGDSRVLMYGDSHNDASTSGFQYMNAVQRGFAKDLLTIYGAVRAATGIHFDPDQRTCHHVGCVHYTENFCNAYPVVPKRFADCGFPNRLKELISTFGSRR